MKQGARRWLWLLPLCAGIALVAVGIFLGEAQIVFTKAVNICLECIGIG